jgi:hypothetical protein
MSLKLIGEVRPADLETKRTHACRKCRVISLGQGNCPDCGQSMFPWQHGTEYRLRWVGGEKQRKKMKERAEAIAYWRALQEKGALS